MAADQCSLQPSLDCRYSGQSYTLNTGWQNCRQAETAFHVAHEARYGHRMDLPVELLNLRMSVSGPAPDIVLADTAGQVPQEMLHSADRIRHYQRASLAPGAAIQGPAIITEQVATTWVAEGWSCTVVAHGNLLLQQTDG